MINSNSLVQNMPEFRARPHRFRVVCGETKTGTEISAPDINSLQDWIYTIRMVWKDLIINPCIVYVMCGGYVILIDSLYYCIGTTSVLDAFLLTLD